MKRNQSRGILIATVFLKDTSIPSPMGLADINANSDIFLGHK